MTFATGRPRLRIIMPCGSRSSRIRKHLALNSVAVSAFPLIFIMAIIYHVTGCMTSEKQVEESRVEKSRAKSQE